MESRDYLVQSKVVCKGNTKIALPDFTGKVVIEKEEKLTLSLSGSATVKTDQTAVKTGTPMIPDIRITISQTDKGKRISKVEIYSCFEIQTEMSRT